jgi:hypothetical protein
MIEVNSGDLFEARVTSFPTGLVGAQITCLLSDNVGTFWNPASSISESPPGSGSYVTTFTAPNFGGQYSVIWQWGDKSPSRTAAEDVVVIVVEPPVVVPPTVGATPLGPLVSRSGITQPHFDLPFRYGNGREVVIQQDTVEDVRNCVEAGIRTIRGTRPWVPNFGISDPTFENQPIDVINMGREIYDSEPRAVLDMTQFIPVTDELADNITVGVST